MFEEYLSLLPISKATIDEIIATIIERAIRGRLKELTRYVILFTTLSYCLKVELSLIGYKKIMSIGFTENRNSRLFNS